MAVDTGTDTSAGWDYKPRTDPENITCSGDYLFEHLQITKKSLATFSF